MSDACVIQVAWQMYAAALHGSRGLLHFLITPCKSPKVQDDPSRYSCCEVLKQSLPIILQ